MKHHNMSHKFFPALTPDVGRIFDGCDQKKLISIVPEANGNKTLITCTFHNGDGMEESGDTRETKFEMRFSLETECELSQFTTFQREVTRALDAASIQLDGISPMEALAELNNRAWLCEAEIQGLTKQAYEHFINRMDAYLNPIIDGAVAVARTKMIALPLGIFDEVQRNNVTHQSCA